MEPKQLKAFYRVPEVQQILNMGRTKVYELIRSGVILSVDIDGNIRVPVIGLEEWIARKIATSSPNRSPTGNVTDLASTKR